MWHKPCRTFHPWCPCIKTRCMYMLFCRYLRQRDSACFMHFNFQLDLPEDHIEHAAYSTIYTIPWYISHTRNFDVFFFVVSVCSVLFLFLFFVSVVFVFVCFVWEGGVVNDIVIRFMWSIPSYPPVLHHGQDRIILCVPVKYSLRIWVKFVDAKDSINRNWIQYNIEYNMTKRKLKLCSKYRLPKDTPYLAFTGELWAIISEIFGEK